MVETAKSKLLHALLDYYTVIYAAAEIGRIEVVQQVHTLNGRGIGDYKETHKGVQIWNC